MGTTLDRAKRALSHDIIPTYCRAGVFVPCAIPKLLGNKDTRVSTRCYDLGGNN